MVLINLLVIVLLISLTGFFVVAEFAIVKVRTSRMEQLMSERKKNAVSAIKVVNHLDEMSINQSVNSESRLRH